MAGIAEVAVASHIYSVTKRYRTLMRINKPDIRKQIRPCGCGAGGSYCRTFKAEKLQHNWHSGLIGETADGI